MQIAVFVTSRERPEALNALLASALASGDEAISFRVLLQGEHPHGVGAHADDPRVAVRRVPLMSLSAARNIALPDLRGDIVWFADDDCRLPPGALAHVRAAFAADPALDVLSLRSVDENGSDSMGRFPTAPVKITRANVWNCGVSYTLFWRRRVVDRVGAFDEQLGVGAPTRWGAGEETDYLLRAIAAGFRCRFDPGASVIHPDKSGGPFAAKRARLAGYGRGAGRVLHKHGYPQSYVLLRAARTLAGCVYLAATLRPHQTPHRLADAYHRTTEYFRLRREQPGG